MYAVWDGRSDGSRDEAGSSIWGLVNGRGNFWGKCRAIEVAFKCNIICFTAAF